MTETEQTTKPLPCPFCGAEKITIAEGSTYRWAHATCVECGAAAGDIRREYPQGTDDPEVQEAAIAEWNVRDTRELDALTAQLRTANAEVARLMPLPEIYTLWKKIIEDGNPSRDTVAHFVELAHEAAERAAAAPADLRTPTDKRIAALEAQLAEAETNENFKIDLMNGLREDLSQAQRLLGVDRQRNAALEEQLAEARATIARVKEDHNDTLRRLESAQGRIARLELKAEAWDAEEAVHAAAMALHRASASEIPHMTDALSEAIREANRVGNLLDSEAARS